MNRHLIILFVFFLTCGCVKTTLDDVSCLQITHRDGLEETISDQNQLKRYKEIDFKKPQNYQKVVQYQKKMDKRVSSIMTYHTNGSLDTLLETKNSRAHGKYLQYYDNGQIYIQANVIEGRADVTDEAKMGFIFNGAVHIFDRKGGYISKMNYSRGKLQGQVSEYWPNQQIKKQTPYENGLIDGQVDYFDEKNELIGQENYSQGKKDGKSFRNNLFEERYEEDLIIEGKYYNEEGKEIVGVRHRVGTKPIYIKGKIIELVEIQSGKKNGFVQIFSDGQNLINEYTMIEEKKEGLETCYFDTKEKVVELQMPWSDDVIQGMVKSYYKNAKLKSQLEMIKNKKHGLSITYYENGTLMMMEEYNQDKLVSGKYYKMGEECCCSSINEGQGLATIFDSRGEFLRTLEYKDYKIQVPDDEN